MSRPVAVAEARLAPSLLSCDFARIADEIACVADAGVKMLHLDVMDGHFVPNLTFGPVVVKHIRQVTDLPLDTHLMISKPAQYVGAFAEAGSDLVSFHVEADDDPGEVIELIRASGAQVGLALSPPTPIERVLPWLDRIDMLLVMTVNPGFGGQSFMADMLDKVRTVRERMGPEFPIEVDGGISPATIAAARGAGANLLVAGSAIFGKADRQAAIDALAAHL